MNQQYHHTAAIFIAVSVGLAYGSAQSITAGVLEDEHFAYLSSLVKGIISSAVLVGAFIGCFASGFLSDKYGPKRVILISSIIVFIPTIILSIIDLVFFFILFRLLSGLGMGAMSSIAPLYITEQSSPERRGTHVAVYQLSITLGIVFDYIITFLFHNLTYGWRLELILSVAINIIIVPVCLFFLPESTVWKTKMQRKLYNSQMSRIFKRNLLSVDSALDDPDAPFATGGDHQTASDDELVLLPGDASSQAIPSSTSPPLRSAPANPAPPRPTLVGTVVASLKELWSSLASCPRPSVISLVLALACQLTGINAIIMYAPSLARSIGLDEPNHAMLASIFVGLWNSATTLGAVFTIDRIGRRPLLLGGFALMAAGNLLTMLGMLLWSPLAFLGIAVFLLGYESGPGPVFSLLVSEIFPLAVRGRAASTFMGVNWLGNIVIVLLYPTLAASLGSSTLFAVFSLLCFLVSVFVYIMVPETKGKSLSQIEAEMMSESRRPPQHTAIRQPPTTTEIAQEASDWEGTGVFGEEGAIETTQNDTLKEAEPTDVAHQIVDLSDPDNDSLV